jgi:hypothetical protein
MPATARAAGQNPRRATLTIYQFWFVLRLSITFGHFCARYVLICEAKSD